MNLPVIIMISASVLLTGINMEKVRYDNYRLYTLEVNTVNQLELVKNFERMGGGYQLWDLPNFGQNVSVLVPPHKFADFTDLLQNSNFAYQLKIPNIQKLIDQERNGIKTRAFDWNTYFTLDEYNEWLNDKLITFSNVLEEIFIGSTYEDRPIRAVKLSKKTGNQAIFIEANIHAREWVTASTATYFLNELLTSDVPEIQEMSLNIDWYFIPILNVDGYVYSHEMNRLWRKSRQPHSLLCYGTDINRNFDFQWMANGGASDYPCSDFYGGPEPFSEPEAYHLSEFIRQVAADVKIYIALHNYGQYLAIPYGYSGEHTETHEIQEQIGNAMAEAIAELYGTDYIVGNSADIIYVSSGSSVDWVYNGFNNIPVTYTIEMRDRRGGSHGYVLPEDQILQNCQELMLGLRAMVVEARTLDVLQ